MSSLHFMYLSEFLILFPSGVIPPFQFELNSPNFPLLATLNLFLNSSDLGFPIFVRAIFFLVS